MYTDRDDQLNRLLRTSIESLDISDEEYKLAVSRYEAVGAALADYWGGSPAGGEVYPQGSLRLGSVTRKIHRNDEFDIDLVARRDRPKASISQTELKTEGGQGLYLCVNTEPEDSPATPES